MGAGFRPRKPPMGFTLIELVIVIVMLSVLAVFAIGRSISSAEATVSSQADMMAREIRHTQMLATTWEKRLRLSITAGANGVYGVSCVTAGAAPCNSSPVIDPVTGNAMQITLQYNVALAGPATLDFNSIGTPSAAATYTLTANGGVKTIAVQALSGFVTVTP